LHNGQYVVASKSREFAVGRLNLHRDGYGFLISERPIPGVAATSSFLRIPPRRMHGDRVIVRVARIEAGGRADARSSNPEAGHATWSANSNSAAAAPT